MMDEAGDLRNDIDRLRNSHDALVKALERIIDADTTISDGGKVHDHGSSAAIAIEALRGISVGQMKDQEQHS